ncbi:hypothetical protein [uncultured Aquimarina sp.]|uniref:WD40 repeat domain-containing protein n=1 Tax=uncultured Aquimarina sp. TaxID=575652 RepID=UPI00261F9A39|nr:hypothetical protein [uncultured Aquimarina sp.]
MNRTLILVLIFPFFLGCKTSKPLVKFSDMLWTSSLNASYNKIAVGGNNGALRILSTDDLNLVKTYEFPNTITKVEWHPTENLLAVIRQRNDESSSDDSQAKLIDTKSGKTIELDNYGGRGLGWSKDGKYLAIGDGDGIVSVFNVKGELVKRIKTEQKAITGLSWHPHNYKIATVGSHIEIISLENDDKKQIIPRDIEILMLSVEWHPSGDMFATGDYGNSDINYPPLLQFWDSNGTKLKDIEGSESEIRNLKWLNNGKNLLTASDRIRMWDEEGEIIKSSKKESLFWGLVINEKNQNVITTTEYGDIFTFDKKLQIIKTSSLKK